MKQAVVACSAVLFVAVSAFLACNGVSALSERSEGINKEKDSLLVAATSSDAQVARGRYLVTIMGCNDCHSPKKMTAFGPVPDSSLLFSGHPAKMPLAKIDPQTAKDWILFNPNLTAFAGPWGVSFAANLTSGETGIGNWTEAQFLRAIRLGKYKGMENGRSLLPPMPWQQYSLATDEDLRAVFAFLKSTPPVENIVPAPLPPASALPRQ